MTEQAVYGWLISVERPGSAVPEVYNVAILEERLAIEAVRRVLADNKQATVKVKSKLTKPLFEALKMKPGDVMLGARKKTPPINHKERFEDEGGTTRAGELSRKKRPRNPN